MLEIMGIICILYGVLILRFSLTDNDAFFRARHARSIVAAFGRNGARKVYGIMGIFGIIIGLMVLIF
ncbi:MAG: hypothetical protein E7497_01880 [Ruminococcus sp.]|nr:hypothetical protein [Ruminococcus sp.]